MTADDIPAGRELDALVAERVMGWTRRARGHSMLMVDVWDGPVDGPVGIAAWRIPAYSTDIAAARLVEDEIERRGLSSEYTGALAVRIRGDLWDLLRATPEQRCRAALVVVRTVRGET